MNVLTCSDKKLDFVKIINLSRYWFIYKIASFNNTITGDGVLDCIPSMNMLRYYRFSLHKEL